MEDLLGRHTRSWRLGAQAFSVFGVVALVLAVVGLYSVVTFTVAQRLHEFGVRIALGAQAHDITRLTISRGVAPIALGVLIGLVLALAGGKLVASLLFQVSPRDPTVLASVSALLLLSAAVASLVPALRATRADPMMALRAE
jgi:ABC-type antimicrobial peptide transport system permease subunit